MRIKVTLFLAFLLLPFGKKTYGELDINSAQAIFIYNFLTQIQWPEGSVGNNVIVGVLGKTATTEQLKKLTSQRKIGTKSIEVVQYNAASEVSNCQLLLIALNKSSEVAAVQQKTRGKGCLIVAEKSGSIKSGAVIDFNIADGKLRYRISEENAKDQNLHLSAQLVQLASK
jgi:hypothetical protein